MWRERRAEAVSNRGPSAYQPNALPLGQTGSQTHRHRCHQLKWRPNPSTSLHYRGWHPATAQLPGGEKETSHFRPCTRWQLGWREGNVSLSSVYKVTIGLKRRKRLTFIGVLGDKWVGKKETSHFRRCTKWQVGWREGNIPLSSVYKVTSGLERRKRPTFIGVQSDEWVVEKETSHFHRCTKWQVGWREGNVPLSLVYKVTSGLERRKRPTFIGVQNDKWVGEKETSHFRRCTKWQVGWREGNVPLSSVYKVTSGLERRKRPTFIGVQSDKWVGEKETSHFHWCTKWRVDWREGNVPLSSVYKVTSGLERRKRPTFIGVQNDEWVGEKETSHFRRCTRWQLVGWREGNVPLSSVYKVSTWKFSCTIEKQKGQNDLKSGDHNKHNYYRSFWHRERIPTAVMLTLPRQPSTDEKILGKFWLLLTPPSTHTHTRTQATHTHTRTQATHTHTHAPTHARTHARARTHTHTHTHTHTKKNKTKQKTNKHEQFDRWNHLSQYSNKRRYEWLKLDLLNLQLVENLRMFCPVYLWSSSHWRHQSSGTVWKSRWPSWDPVPNKPMVSVNVKQHFNQQLKTTQLHLWLRTLRIPHITTKTDMWTSLIFLFCSFCVEFSDMWN